MALIAGNKIDLTVVDHAYKVPEAVKYVMKFFTSDKTDIIATWDAGSGIMANQLFYLPGDSQASSRLCIFTLW